MIETSPEYESKPSKMSMNPANLKNGQEQYDSFQPTHNKSKRMIQYDYRDNDGELFSCVAATLDKARDKRNAWISKKDTSPQTNTIEYRGKEVQVIDCTPTWTEWLEMAFWAITHNTDQAKAIETLMPDFKNMAKLADQKVSELKEQEA